MRSVQVNAPKDLASAVAQIAFDVGIEVVSVADTTAEWKSGEREPKVTITFEASTPRAKTFVDRLLLAEVYDRQRIWFDVRERRSIVNIDPIHDITYPWVLPSTDLLQDLYQFSHLTWGLVGRVFLAGCLLAYGLMQQSLLLMIAGMMFIPLLPVISGIGFGAWVGHWRLASRATAVLAVSSTILFIAGAAVGAVGDPPIRYTDFPPLAVGALISLAVGIASALANSDDVGRRELIGLAATSQIAIIPAWLGLCTTAGLPASENAGSVEKHALSLVLNVICVVTASLTTYIILKAPHPSLRMINDDK